MEFFMAQATKKKEIETEENLDSPEVFDYRLKYSDVFYETYILSYRKNTKKRTFYRFVKRSFDIIASLLGIILLSPIMLVIAVAIKLDSKGPVIFKQQRVGKGGKPFTCYKFRSMSQTAPHEMATSVLQNADQYVTRVGRVIRKLSLDELPQLFCCLTGKMSVIGYRPLILSEEKCNGMRERLGVFEMRPGISGYAQVVGRDDVYYKNKAILDAEYVKKASILFDIKLSISKPSGITRALCKLKVMTDSGLTFKDKRRTAIIKT
jgi:O-antigen biosynthesis protein WbqP